MNPRTGATWGSRPAERADPPERPGSIGPTGHYDWGPFDALQVDEPRVAAGRGLPLRDLRPRPRWRRQRRSPATSRAATCLSPSAPDAPPSTAVSIARWTRWRQAGTLMHELGHNLGLRPRRRATTWCDKPNYLSVMNYAFQLSGLDVAREPDVLPRLLALHDPARRARRWTRAMASASPAVRRRPAQHDRHAALPAPQHLWRCLLRVHFDFDCSGANGGTVSSRRDGRRHQDACCRASPTGRRSSTPGRHRRTSGAVLPATTRADGAAARRAAHRRRPRSTRRCRPSSPRSRSPR